MDIEDMPLKEVSQTTGPELKLSLVVTEVGDKLAFNTQFNSVSSVHLVQAIMYLLDSAFKGNRDHVEVMVGILPESIKSYYEMKEKVKTEEPVLTQEIIEAIQGLSDRDLSIEVRDQMSKEQSEFDKQYTKKLVEEMYRRSNDRPTS